MKILLYFTLSTFWINHSAARPAKNQKHWEPCYGILHIEASFAFCSLSFSHSDGSDCKNYLPDCENPNNICKNTAPLGASAYGLRDDNCWMGTWANPPCRDYQVECTTFIDDQKIFWAIKPLYATIGFLVMSLVVLSQSIVWVRKLKKEQGRTWKEVMLPELVMKKMGYEVLRPRVPRAPSIRSNTPPTGRASPSDEHDENTPLLFHTAAEGSMLNPNYNHFAAFAEAECDHHNIIKASAAE